jgi:2-polyprenyl-3-methyl-5-hydroxy-6-metoxy-1,4-benzoquinol methylase
MNDFDGYFADHYRAGFSEDEILHHERLLSPHLDHIHRYKELIRSTRVLEIGAGQGGVLMWMKRKNIENVTAIELDREAALNLAKRFPQYSIVTDDIDQYSQSSTDQFDLILAFEVLEHLKSPIESLQKICKLLKPGGFFLGTTPYPFRRNVVSDPTHLFVLHPEGWKRLFERTGFSIKMLDSRSLVPWTHHWRTASYLRLRNPFLGISTTFFLVRKDFGTADYRTARDESQVEGVNF